MYAARSLPLLLLLQAALCCCMVSCCGAAPLPELDIHVVAHTHDDVGWLKTVDEYYYGANDTIQEAGVQYILDSVIPALEANLERRFIYVEIAFFARWWREQDSAMRARVKRLVSETKQLVFTNGGWCMNDEANVHYAAVIDQMQRGHKFLWENFQVKPNVGWHIDPFGHASTTVSLFARMGFEAFFFARMDYQDYELRNKTKNLELIWRGSRSLGAETDMFTHGFYDTTYCFPSGFGFENSNVPPIQDDHRLFNVNIKERADLFAQEMRKRELAFKTPNIMVTFGCDFQYQNANINFKNMDKLMKYLNANRDTYGLNVHYSTPIDYTRAVHGYAEKNSVAFEMKTDDFFPYADNRASFWTGYFTSRPALKGYVRSRANVLHAGMRSFTAARAALNQIDSQPDAGSMARLDRLWEAFSVAQHHDAVAGTEKQHVADDYAERLSLGTTEVHEVMSATLGAVAAKKAGRGSAAPGFAFCEYLNISLCDPLAQTLRSGQTAPVLLYNGLARERNEYVRLPIPAEIVVRVLGPDGKAVPSQVFPDTTGRPNVNTLVFAAEKVPPMGFTTYFVEPTSAADPAAAEQARVSTVPGAAGQVENEFYSVSIDGKTGRWSTVTNKKLGQSLAVEQDYQWYNGSCGACCRNKYPQASGAYIFRPNRTETFPVNAGPAKTTYIKGSLVEEVHATWADWVWSSARLYKGHNFVDVTAKIGEIPIKDNLGKEVVVRYSTPLKTDKQWWTDSEGQEMQHRVRNYRETWNYTITQPVSGNYYPMNTASFIRGSGGAGTIQDLQLTLVTDRSSGVTSMVDGQLENMHHRRLLYDDGRGVGEPLNETEAIIKTQYLTVNTQGGASAVQQRELSLRINNPLLPMFATATSASDWLSSYSATWKPLKAALPPNVHLLSLHTEENGQMLIRINHIFSTGEDQEMSKSVTVDLRQILEDVVVVQAEEMALTANQPRSDIHRWKWAAIGADKKVITAAGSSSKSAKANEFEIELKPMEIRTFLLTVQQG